MRAGLCFAACVSSGFIVTDSSDTNGKLVAWSDTSYVCPAVVNKDNWLGGHDYPDAFKTAHVEGGLLNVTRTDGDTGWELELEFECCKGEW